MILRYLFLWIFFFGLGQIQAQIPTFDANEALETARKKGGYKKVRIYKGSKLERNVYFTPSKSEFYLITAGLQLSFSPKDSLRKLYPDYKESNHKLGSTHYDSLARTLTIEQNNTMMLSTTVYAFDSLGRIASCKKTWMGEAGGQGSSEIRYHYNIVEHTIKVEISYPNAFDKAKSYYLDGISYFSDKSRMLQQEVWSDKNHAIELHYKYQEGLLTHCIEKKKSQKKQITRRFRYVFEK